jgi:hypothetical protein
MNKEFDSEGRIINDWYLKNRSRKPSNISRYDQNNDIKSNGSYRPNEEIKEESEASS